MEAWMAFISIMAIVAIVVVGGGIIAFIGHMIIGAFDNNKQSRPTNSKDVIDYAQYKQLEDAKQVNVNNEYDFKAINQAKAKEEKSLLDAKEDEIFNTFLKIFLKKHQFFIKFFKKTVFLHCFLCFFIKF